MGDRLKKEVKATCPRLGAWPQNCRLSPNSYFEKWLTFLFFLCPPVELKFIQLNTNKWNWSLVQVLINLEPACTKGCESFWTAAWSNTHSAVRWREHVWLLFPLSERRICFTADWFAFAGENLQHTLIWSFGVFFAHCAHCLGPSLFKKPANVSRSMISSCASLKKENFWLPEKTPLCAFPGG